MKQPDGRIEAMTRRNAAEGRKAFVAYFMSGDPDTEWTYRCIMGAIEGGASLIELGVPYSDPAADGEAIRRAGARALEAGTGMEDVFDLARRIRAAAPDTPIAMMLYYNLVYRYGVQRYFDTCAEAGIDACILPDMPLEEQDEIREPARTAGIRLIQLVTPYSGNRIPRICARAEGFLYCVSTLGTTGERDRFAEGLSTFLDTLTQHTDVPRFVGFGIARPEQARELARHADGVIVGSALVRLIEEQAAAGADAPTAAAAIRDRVRAFCDVLKTTKEEPA